MFITYYKLCLPYTVVIYQMCHTITVSIGVMLTKSHAHTYPYIYIYIEREREKERGRAVFTSDLNRCVL